MNSGIRGSAAIEVKPGTRLASVDGRVYTVDQAGAFRVTAVTGLPVQRVRLRKKERVAEQRAARGFHPNKPKAWGRVMACVCHG